MKALAKTLATAVIALGASAAANALPTPFEYTDLVTQEVKVTEGHSYTYNHNVVDNGFEVGSDWIHSFLLSIDLFDDRDKKRETVQINIEGGGPEAEYSSTRKCYLGIFCLSEYVDLSNYISAGSEFLGAGLKALGALNDTGILEITISSLRGDFYVGRSMLKVFGLEYPSNGNGNGNGNVSVPEPGILALFLLGALAVGGVAALRSRRRSFAAAA